MSEPRWIIPANWDRFQHYQDRDPKWVKVWTRLLSDDDYIDLSFHLRGVLVGLWMAYAATNGQLRDTTSTLNRQLGGRVTTRDLASLNHAGFIGLSDTKPAQIRTQEKEVEKERFKKTPRSKPGAAFALRTLIANGVITDTVDLDAEINGAGINLNDLERAELRRALSDKGEAA